MQRFIATLILVLTCGGAFALPLGNPSSPTLLSDGLLIEGHCYDFCTPGVGWCDAFSFRFGYYGDFVFNRHLEVDKHKNADDIEDTEITTNAGYLVLNFWDRLDFFATLGATSFYIDSNAFTFGVSATSRFAIETETAFSYSLGTRFVFFECRCATFGAEFQYFYTKPDVTRWTLAEQTSAYPDYIARLKYREWQFGLGMAYRIWNLVPYVGTKFSGAKVNFGEYSFPPNNVFFPNLTNKFFWGYAIGVSLIDCDRMAMTVEARYPDEKAVYVNGQIRF